MTKHLVLIPGLNNTQAVFDGVVAALPNSILPHAFNNPPLATVEAIAQALLAQSPERFWLAGFSFGGYVALAMLEAAPERIAGIAMLCTAPFADNPAASQKRLGSLEMVAQGRYFEMVDAQAANAFHPNSLANACLIAARQKMVRDYGAQRYEAHVRATSARPDRSHLLTGRHPTMVVAASHDKVFASETLARYASAIPNARYELVENAGHLVPMEKPAEIARLLANWVESSV
jgi:pimeloyl-ACP methyl ester carboxylesterase